ncbi:type I restriction enzyme HsdR N-terminal domain-containing protein [Mucilaginibacter koreensis]
MDLLQPLNLPPHPFRLTEHEGRLYIFDELRKKELLLTPEEWVRQHFIQFLIKEKGYPKGLIKVEGGLKLNHMPRRTDIVVYNRQGEKILLVECKAPEVNITQAVFDQIARYNMVHRVPLLSVSNGLQHYFCTVNITEKSYRFIEGLPPYQAEA